MIRVEADSIGDSSDTGRSIPKPDALYGKIKCVEYNRVVNVGWIFPVVFGVALIGIFAVRSALFEGCNIIVNKVAIQQGVDDVLFCRGLESKFCTDVL